MAGVSPGVKGEFGGGAGIFLRWLLRIRVKFRFPSASAPRCDEMGESCATYIQQLESWHQGADLDPAKRNSALLRMDMSSREVIMGRERAGEISELLLEFFAPDAAGPVRQKVVGFLHLELATQTMDGYAARWDPLRRKRGAPLTSAPRLQNPPSRAPRKHCTSPVVGETWGCLLLPDGCVVCLAHAGVLLDRMVWWRRTWARLPMRMTILPQGRRTVTRKRGAVRESAGRRIEKGKR